LTTAIAKTILVIDDDRDVLRAAALTLRPLATAIQTLESPEHVLAAIDAESIDAILLDMNFATGKTSGAEGLVWLDRIVRRAPDIAIVLMTAYGAVSVAVEALKRGAADFILKPWHNEKLIATMTAAVALTRARRDAARVNLRVDTLELDDSTQQVGPRLESPQEREIATLVQKVGSTNADVLLLGESGTGKEITARALHRASTRASRPFVAVDLGAVPESLFESELFGHRRGAFTGATADRVGQIESAQGGTLFLDEIGNLPLQLQSKMLTVLERREVLPIGATRPIPIDVRLICATNLSEDELRQATRFRQDLLFRIKTVQIVLPALRTRAADILPLLDHFLDFYARKHRVQRRPLAAEARAMLERYSWPGNIRELRHAAESATILASGEELSPADFAFARSNASGPAQPDTFDLDEIERRAILRALEHFDGNISKAALALGLTRPALYRRISRHGL